MNKLHTVILAAIFFTGIVIFVTIVSPTIVSSPGSNDGGDVVAVANNPVEDKGMLPEKDQQDTQDWPCQTFLSTEGLSIEKTIRYTLTILIIVILTILCYQMPTRIRSHFLWD